MKFIARFLLVAGILVVLFAAFPKYMLATEPPIAIVDVDPFKTPLPPTPASSPTHTGEVVATAVFEALPQPTRTSGGLNLDALNPELQSGSGKQDPVVALRVPARIVIPSINLDAPVKAATLRKVLFEGYVFDQWNAPKEFAAGWHTTSALLGESGNTVMSGHNNEFKEVFRNLENLNPGETIQVFSALREYRYQITNKMILPEAGESRQKRLENAGWISWSEDERLTLVTCWPYESNTHRLIIVARPVK